MNDSFMASDDYEAASGRILTDKDYQAFLNVYIQQNNKKEYLKYIYGLFKDNNENFLGYFYKTANDRLSKEYKRLQDIMTNQPDMGSSELIFVTELKQLVNDVLRDATLIQDEEERMLGN
ncbi:MAG: hypothetical protein HXX13_06200 [Bacteroidetes bacterium]|nr:hypothetical protein [Bacteroidota bacterium]